MYQSQPQKHNDIRLSDSSLPPPSIAEKKYRFNKPNGKETKVGEARLVKIDIVEYLKQATSLNAAQVLVFLHAGDLDKFQTEIQSFYKTSKELYDSYVLKLSEDINETRKQARTASAIAYIETLSGKKIEDLVIDFRTQMAALAKKTKDNSQSTAKPDKEKKPRKNMFRISELNMYLTKRSVSNQQKQYQDLPLSLKFLRSEYGKAWLFGIQRIVRIMNMETARMMKVRPGMSWTI